MGLLSPHLPYPNPRGKGIQLAANFLHIHGAIATSARIRFRVVLNDIVTLQFIKGYAHQGRRVEKQVFSALLLLDKAKTAVRNSCDCSLCH